MKRYKNYIFDLYATLVDIRTDEEKQSLWDHMSQIYSRHGAVYTADELHRDYIRLIREEEEAIKLSISTEFPEIDIEKIFLRLYTQKQDHPVAINHECTKLICSVFRTLSMEWLRLYPGVIKTLEWLKKAGCSIYLLSNAQSAFTRPELDMLGLAGYFDDIFISSEHQIKKPDPAFLEKLMAKHLLSPVDTVMIGNEVGSDMLIADACGIKGILVNTARMSMDSIKQSIETSGIRHPEAISILQPGDLTALLKPFRIDQAKNRKQRSLTVPWPENLLGEVGLELVFGRDEYLPLSSDQEDGLVFAIGQMGDRVRDIVFNRYKDGQSYAGIAETYGISSTRVAQIIAKVIRLLRKPDRLIYCQMGYHGLLKLQEESKEKGIPWYPKEALYQMPIGDLGISPTVVVQLFRYGYKTVGEVIEALEEDPTTIIRIRRLGRKSVSGILERLEYFGFDSNEIMSKKEEK